MLWHLEHRHTGATCFSKDEEKKALWDEAMDAAKENGVTVHHFLLNPLATDFCSWLRLLIMNLWKRPLGVVKHWVKWKKHLLLHGQKVKNDT